MSTIAVREPVSAGHHPSASKPDYAPRHSAESLRNRHRTWHTSELPTVKPGWFRYLEKRGRRKAGAMSYQNDEQSFTIRTLGAVIFLAFAIGVACAAGVHLFGWVVGTIRVR